MTTYDQVVPKLLSECQDFAGFAELNRACIVRDLKGCVRLVVEPAEGKAVPELERLSQQLEKALDGWFSPPILRTDSDHDAEARLARHLLQAVEKEAWPEDWPTEVREPILGTVQPLGIYWRALQRTITKMSWLSTSKSSLPWPLKRQTPPIVSFYSYKGGVGRSTLLAIMALQLARQGKKVAVVDLDLEAPGLGSLFEVKPDQGVLDFILSYLATGKSSISNLKTTVSLQGCNVDVYAAGLMGWSYLEKLARLDFLSGDDPNQLEPVGKALTRLLLAIRRESSPDYIFLDSRAGLHDLGGLSLHALGHVDVLVSRAVPQALDGLELTLRALARRRQPDDQRLIIVQSFARPPLASTVSLDDQKRFRTEVYGLFEKTLYQGLGDSDLPALDDRTFAHYPWPIPLYDELSWITSLRDLSDSARDSEPLQEIRKRIVELCEPPEV